MTDAIDLTTEQRKTLNDLLRRFLPGVAVWAYGSRVKWTARPNSDLDLVAFTTPAQRPHVADLKEALAESNLPFPVDLHVWDDVPERFREIIRNDYVVVQEGRQQPAMSVEKLVGPIPTGWEYTTLGVACKRGGGDIQTGPFGSQLHAADYVPVGIPSIMPQNIGDNRIIEDDIARITPEDAKRLSRYLVRKGDIVYSRRGDVELRALVRDKEDGWLCGTGCLRVRLGEQGPDPQFATYYLGHSGVREWIVRHAHGATMPNLNTSILGACPFVVPPLPEQRAIAHILGTLDDKIELNRRMNETLEAMARALFKSWFVDFDPVRAKAEGRDTDLPKHIADFFPSHLVDSELGKIPDGWGVGPLDRALVLQRGFDLPATQRTSGTYPVLAASGPSGTHNEFMVRSPGVTTGRSGVLGKVFYVHDDFWPLNTSLWVKEFRHSTPAYAFHLLHGLDFGLFNAGSAVPTLNRNHVHNLSTLLPPMGLIRAFERIAAASLKRQKHNDDQSQTVASLRDTLLPKLISGELRVKDTERFMERGCEPTARHHDSDRG